MSVTSFSCSVLEAVLSSVVKMWLRLYLFTLLIICVYAANDKVYLFIRDLFKKCPTLIHKINCYWDKIFNINSFQNTLEQPDTSDPAQLETVLLFGQDVQLITAFYMMFSLFWNMIPFIGIFIFVQNKKVSKENKEVSKPQMCCVWPMNS